MKILWQTLIVVSALAELMAAVTLIGGPGGITAAGSGSQWSMHYGFAALAVASLSLWVWPRRTNADAVHVALGVLTTFHVGVFLSLTLAGDQAFGMLLHGVLSVMCIVLVAGRRGIIAH
ncbi:MAG: hypothetical protein AAF529_20540 [Pseudomonadota bacterium]